MSPPIDSAILAYYDRVPEESRLDFGAFKLERERTRELIARYVPPPRATIFDVGGAAGAYAFWLAEHGYDVHLIDATPRLVDVARQRNLKATRPLLSCTVGDARALDVASESADAVLLLGPLYHLCEAADRARALREALRVLRRGGTLFAAAISRWASLLDGLSRELLDDPSFRHIVERDLISGRHENISGRADFFTTAYFQPPEELRREVTDAGFFDVRVFGIEGVGWIFPDFDERWNDPARRAVLLDAARLAEEEPSMLGSSPHVMAVARKR
jgi:ubiquinone/menaquinone biosynthesis C-methylase UbiE